MIRYGTPQGRAVLLATILGSSLVSLSSTVVYVVLPPIGQDLDVGITGLQWVLSGYRLALAALILLGGALGDRYGRRRVFVIGVVWFSVAGLLCAVAQTGPQLVAARVLEGIGGALLVPGSLAIIEAVFHPDDRGRAIGAWSGLGGLAAVIGPFVGGALVEVSWRWVFALNLPLAIPIVLAARRVPESANPAAGPLDLGGAVTGVVGLGGVTYALIAVGDQGLSPAVLGSAAIGLAGLVGFVVAERRSRMPMLPLEVFSSSQFTWTNVVTFAVYGAFGVVFFLLTLQLQQVLGYSPLESGLATLPSTLLLLVLSTRAGHLSSRIGPRLPMAAGCLLMGLGIALYGRIVDGASYVGAVLPADVTFGLGLALTVAPLTTTVLAAAPDELSGVASGVNNAVSRAGQLIAVALVPVLVGLTGDAFTDPAGFSAGFRAAMVLSAALVAGSGLLAWLTIDPGPHEPLLPRHHHAHCSVEATPLRART